MCFSIFCLLIPIYLLFFFFFFNDTATTEIYTLSLHDALPIWDGVKDSTVFSYRLPEAMPVTIQVSDEQSRLLRTGRPAGTAASGAWSWDGLDDEDRKSVV